MHYCMASKFAYGAVQTPSAQEHHRTMPKSAPPPPKPARRPTFIRSWRKHRGLTLAQLADRLATELEVQISEGQLSRIERGETPYSQDILEAIAPGLPSAPAWSLWDTLKPVERLQAVEIIKTLKRTALGS